MKILVAALRAAFSKISPPSGARAREASGELPSWEGARSWVSVGWAQWGGAMRTLAVLVTGNVRLWGRPRAAVGSGAGLLGWPL